MNNNYYSQLEQAKNWKGSKEETIKIINKLCLKYIDIYHFNGKGDCPQIGELIYIYSTKYKDLEENLNDTIYNWL